MRKYCLILAKDYAAEVKGRFLHKLI